MTKEEFKEHLKKKMNENRAAFEGAYKDELNDLMGLSRSEIDKITPDTTDIQTYDHLITVVKEASKVNLSQAELKSNIEELGDVAIEIAKKVPKIASLFL